MADPLHYIHPSISNFHTARTSTPWLIIIFYLCFTSIHSWDGPNPSPFCLLCAIMNLGQSSTLQYPLSPEPCHFIPFSSISGLYLMGTSNLGFYIPFPFSHGHIRSHILALRKRRREGGGSGHYATFFHVAFQFTLLFLLCTLPCRSTFGHGRRRICDDVMNFLALILLFA